MKRLALAGFVLTATVGAVAQNAGQGVEYQPTARVYFSPSASEADSPTFAVIREIDGETVVTGSFNFTQAGEKSNAENLLVLKDAALALRYESNWQTHAAHSYKIGAEAKAAAGKAPGNGVRKWCNVAIFATPTLRACGSFASDIFIGKEDI
jgi:hypothetical protein